MALTSLSGSMAPLMQLANPNAPRSLVDQYKEKVAGLSIPHYSVCQNQITVPHMSMLAPQLGSEQI